MIEILRLAGYSERDIELYLEEYRNPMGKDKSLEESYRESLKQIKEGV